MYLFILYLNSLEENTQNFLQTIPLSGNLDFKFSARLHERTGRAIIGRNIGGGDSVNEMLNFLSISFECDRQDPERQAVLYADRSLSFIAPLNKVQEQLLHYPWR